MHKGIQNLGILYIISKDGQELAHSSHDMIQSVISAQTVESAQILPYVRKDRCTQGINYAIYIVRQKMNDRFGLENSKTQIIGPLYLHIL
jgi:hypothetical protein